jgi:hypothetical protein
MRTNFFLMALGLLLAVQAVAHPLLDALEAAPAPRLAERQAVHEMTLTQGKTGPNQAATNKWFAALRLRMEAARDPELKAFLASQCDLDPGVKPQNLRAAAPVQVAAYQPGEGPLARLVDAQRAFELGQTVTVRVEELVAWARGSDAGLANRALKLLRRQDAALAAPMLWERLVNSKRRSEVLEWEEEVLRLPLAAVAKGFPKQPAEAWSKPARAAWLRLIAVRPQLRINAALIEPLLKGPADEVTEAAWEAVPQIFTLADRPRLEAAATGLSERLAPRAREAIQRLR